MGAPDKQVAVLEVIDGPDGVKGNRVDHKGIPLVIGRAPSVDLVILDPKISKNHAIIEIRGKHYYLVDLDSKNGTLLNGERILRPEGAQLKHGDDIHVGEARLKFYLFENLADAEIQAIQKRITLDAIRKYSKRSAVLFCEIPDFRELYTKYEVAEVDAIRDKFVATFRDLVHEGAPYYAEPRGELALACFETSAGAFEFAKTLIRRIERLNIDMLRDPKAAIKKIDIRIGIEAGSLALALSEEGRIDKVVDKPMITSRVVCESARPGELLITEQAYKDLPESLRAGLEEKKEKNKFGKLYKYLADTTAYL